MIGLIVDGREVVRRLGAGGMGEVYLARDRDGATRAIKLLRTDHRAAHNAAARFRREALALGRLCHDAVVQIVDAGALPTGELYLAMEYVAGPDLQATVTADGPFAPSDALAILARVASALAYAHGAGVVHRDLKPSNVLLADGDPHHAKIIDFGLAKILADESLTRLTEDQQVLGSPLYWAPEQSASAAVGPAADIYALGGLAYFALSGQPLFRPRPAVALVYAHVNERPESLATRCAPVALPPGLDALVAACVAKAPDARPHAAHVAAELARMLAEAPAGGERRRGRRLFTTTGANEHDQALANQLRHVLLDLAGALARSTADIDRLQDELSERELELAMLDSEVDASPTESLAQRHVHIAAMVGELDRALDDAYRALYDDVLAARALAPDDALALFAELDAIAGKMGAG